MTYRIQKARLESEREGVLLLGLAWFFIISDPALYVNQLLLSQVFLLLLYFSPTRVG